MQALPIYTSTAFAYSVAELLIQHSTGKVTGRTRPLNDRYPHSCRSENLSEGLKRVDSTRLDGSSCLHQECLVPGSYLPFDEP